MKPISHSRRRWLWALLPFLSVSCLAGSRATWPFASTSDSQKPISVTSELVSVPVSVTDAQGNFVPGLSRENFRIYEDNRPQEISLFEQEDTPVSVGLLVDHSGSMESKLSNVASAVAAFAHSSNPRDEMFVVDFGDDVTVELMGGKAFTSDSGDLQQAVLAVSARGRTALYDAVAEGLIHLRLARWPKKSLILISDGGDNASHNRYSQIRASARTSQVSIYAIGLVNEAGEEENPRVLRQLCKDTGGLAFFPKSRKAVVDYAIDFARDLREQYLLGFVPQERANGAPFRKLEVRVIVPGRGKLRVRTRPGYSLSGNESMSPKSGGESQ
jgi:Ca-activated chloride channel homolog